MFGSWLVSIRSRFAPLPVTDVAVAALLAATACSGQTATSTGQSTACIPGATLPCTCEPGQLGALTCGVNSEWAKSCVCPLADAGEGTDATTGDGDSDGSDGGTPIDDEAGPAGNEGGAGIDAATTATGCVSGRACSVGCTDLPGAPLIDGTGQAFDASSASGGPCILEPADGALLPNNWVRPRFKWAGGTQPFKLTVHSPVEANDLTVYTSNSQWTMPAGTWAALAANGWDDGSGANAITVTVADSAGASSVRFSVAPANAGGSIVYFSAAGTTSGWSWLERFAVGDETASKILTAPTGPYEDPATNVARTLSRDSGGNLTTANRDTNVPLTPTGGVECIGCHTSAPDAKSVTFADFYPWDGVAAAVDSPETGQAPSWLTPGGAETLSQGWIGMMSFSPGVWGPGHYRVVAGTQVPTNATTPPWNAGSSQGASSLIWIDLGTSAAPSYVQNGTPLPSAVSSQAPTTQYYANKGTTYGTIARSGDSNSASCPSWSHDGSTIVYVSNDAPQDGYVVTGTGDLYTVPYSGGAGGTAKPLSGAATSSLNEFYPAYSPDDRYVAFTAAPVNTTMYYNAKDEIYVIPSSGGTATRLEANDPPACLNAPSPGVTNSWPRWSPEHPSCNGKTYYWVVFSSTRLAIPFTIDSTKKNFKTGMSDGPTSQLYIAAVVDDGSGTPTTYPATYIWNQSTQTTDGFAQSNHMPDWNIVAVP